MQTARTLYPYVDGGVLCVVSSHELIQVPIWSGNRTINLDHVDSIRKQMDTSVRYLDKNYTVVVKTTKPEGAEEVLVERFVIDGQHRLHIMRSQLTSDATIAPFDVTCTMYYVTSEEEIETLFKRINFAKPIDYTSDPNLHITSIIKKLKENFNTNPKYPLIRDGTRAPYLDEKRLRIAMIPVGKQLLALTVDQVVSRFVEKNTLLITTGQPSDKTGTFALGAQASLSWIPAMFK